MLEGENIPKSRARMMQVEFGRLPYRLQAIANRHGSFCVIATHLWDQKDEKSSNLMYYPNDPRWSDEDFAGFVVDLVCNYFNRQGLRGNKYLSAIASLLHDIAINGRDKIV